jgi:hypothetical protein
MAASRRAEQRRLLSFVRLVDTMMSDTLHSCLTASVSEVLQATRPPAPGQLLQLQLLQGDRAQGGSAAATPKAGLAAQRSLHQGPSGKQAAVAAAATPGWAPLFAVEVVMEGDGEGLAFVPDPVEFKVRWGRASCHGDPGQVACSCLQEAKPAELAGSPKIPKAPLACALPACREQWQTPPCATWRSGATPLHACRCATAGARR